MGVWGKGERGKGKGERGLSSMGTKNWVKNFKSLESGDPIVV